MAHYAIGDVQGCFDELQLLLFKIGFNYGTDTLWLTGDIVNRGPKSLETIRFVKKHADCMQTILGNHDLNLLAIAYGAGEQKKGDTIDEILKADDRQILLDWLRRQPLLIRQNDYLLVHAGLLAQWNADTALSLAADVESAIGGCDYRTVFNNMYGNKPARYKPDLSGMNRIRLIMNAMTRMRVISKQNNKLDFDFKSSYENIPENLCAWFDAENRQHLDYTVIFGHWSALGLYQNNNVICLDTGALWGGKLTAINLSNQEIIQVDAINSIPLQK